MFFEVATHCILSILNIFQYASCYSSESTSIRPTCAYRVSSSSIIIIIIRFNNALTLDCAAGIRESILLSRPFVGDDAALIYRPVPIGRKLATITIRHEFCPRWISHALINSPPSGGDLHERRENERRGVFRFVQSPEMYLYAFRIIFVFLSCWIFSIG